MDDPAVVGLAAALVAALIFAGVLYVRLLLERSRRPYSEDDLKASREETLRRSQAVLSGRVGEHFAPLLPWFLARFNPRDARFIGTPVDFVVFNGLDEDQCTEVVLVEVKTGARASLTGRERRVRECVEAGRVRFEIVHVSPESADALPESTA